MQRFKEQHAAREPPFGHPWSIGSYIEWTATNDQSRRSHYFKSKQTSLPQQNSQKLKSLIGKNFCKNSWKHRMHFDKTSPKKTQPAMQWKISPIGREHLPTGNTAQNKITWLTAIGSHVSLHYLPRNLRSTASSNMRQNVYCNLKWTMLLLHNNDQQQKNRSPVRPRNGE